MTRLVVFAAACALGLGSACSPGPPFDGFYFLSDQPVDNLDEPPLLPMTAFGDILEDEQAWRATPRFVYYDHSSGFAHMGRIYVKAALGSAEQAPGHSIWVRPDSDDLQVSFPTDDTIRLVTDGFGMLEPTMDCEILSADVVNCETGRSLWSARLYLEEDAR